MRRKSIHLRDVDFFDVHAVRQFGLDLLNGWQRPF